MSSPKIQIHQSMIGMLYRCGEQFRRRYGARFGWAEKEEIIPPGVALITGIATHKSVERNLKSKIETGELLPIEAVKEVAYVEAAGLWTKEVTLNDDEVENKEKTREGSIDMSIALAGLHATELAPILNPKSVERKWVINLNDYPYDLAGTWDIEEEGSRHIETEKQSAIIRDTKTAAKSPVANAVHLSEQLTMYSLAKTVCDNELPPFVYLDTLVKTKTPKIIIQSARRTEHDHAVLMRRIERAMEIIEKGAFTPANTSDWICSSKFCGYFYSCPFASKQK